MQTSSSPHATRPGAAQTAAAAASLLLLILVMLLGYTFVHESGHLLAGLAFGARVTSFNVNFFNLSAHVGLDGDFSPLQNALISLAGVSLPFLLWAAGIWLAPGRGHLLYNFFRLGASMAVIHSLLAWAVIPWLVMHGQVVSDDSAAFLGYSGFPPPLVSAAALLVYLGGWVLFLRRSDGWTGLLASLRGQPLEFTSPQARRVVVRLLGAGALLAAVSLALGAAAGTSRQAVVPEGYELLASYDLRETTFANSPAYQFELKSPARISLFFTLSDIEGAPMEIRLNGPSGYENVFLRFNDEKAQVIGHATVHPQDLALEPGMYQIMLTFPPGRGKIAIYMKY